MDNPMEPGKVYGFKRLRLSRSEELPADKQRDWGSKGPCRGTRLPFLLTVVRFEDSYAVSAAYHD